LWSGCGPDGGSSADSQSLLESRAPNHPNSVVAAKVQATPVVYPWRFVVMADTHLPTGADTFTALRRQMLDLSPIPVFVIVVGDLTESGSVQEHLDYLAVTDAFPIPLFSVIGNHEMVPGNRKNYETYHGPENFSFDHAGCRLVALNDIVPRRNGFTDAQIAWLEGELSAPGFPDKFVFMHAPPPDVPPPWGAPPFPNADKLAELSEHYGVRMVATGHIHEFRHRLVGTVHYLVTGGAGGTQNSLLEDPPSQGIFHHFLLVTLAADGRSRVEVIKMGDWPEPDPNYTIRLDTHPVGP
jgi:predicted phosphodiesterase